MLRHTSARSCEEASGNLEEAKTESEAALRGIELQVGAQRELIAGAHVEPA